MKIRAMCVASLFALGACGGGGGSGNGMSGTGTMVPANTPPVAEAGGDVSSADNTTVTLSGSASDSDGQISSTAWSQVSGPTANISGADTLNASITIGDLSENASLVFELTVTDNDGATSSDQVTVEVSNISTELLAALGPLSGAEISIRQSGAPDTVIFSATTSEDGTFVIQNEDFASEDSLYLVVVTGGIDTDPDDDGEDDGTRIDHTGAFRGYLTGKQLTSPGATVSVLSDIAWYFSHKRVDEISELDLLTRLDDVASALILEDLNGDGSIDSNDLSLFQPTSDQATLTFNYTALFSPYPLSDDRSIIDAYHLGLETERQSKLETLFGGRLTSNYELDSRSSSVSVRLSVFGGGTVTSSDGALAYEFNGAGYNSELAVYEASSDEITFTATPGPGRMVHSWKGCQAVSADLSQCSVTLEENRMIEPVFAYAQAELVEEYVDLSTASTTIEGDTVTLLIGHNDNELAAKALEIENGWFITGNANGGFLRKVESKIRISKFRYRFETSFASVEDVVMQGTLLLEKDITFDSILRAAVQKHGLKNSTPFMVNPDAKNPLDASNYVIPTNTEGVSIIKTQSGNDNDFTVVFGKPQAGEICERLQNDPDAEYTGRATGSETIEFVDAEGNTATISGCVTLVTSLDFGAEFGFRSLDYLKVVPSVQVAGASQVLIGGEWSSEGISEDKKRRKIAEVAAGPYPVNIGLLPVWITPTLQLFLGADGKVTGGLEFGFEASSVVREGVVYDKQFGTTRVSEKPDTTIDPIGPRLTAAVEVIPNLQTTLVVQLYNFDAFSLPVKAYIRTKAEVTADTADGDFWRNSLCVPGVEWNVWGGINAKFNLLPIDTDDVGANTILGKIISDKIQVSLDVFTKEWKLDNGTVGGTCPSADPKLEVVGTDILGITQLGRSDIFSKRYELSNLGDSEMEWRASFQEGGPVSVSPTEGTLIPGDIAIVEVIADTSQMDVGVYQNEIRFRNLEAAQFVSDASSGTTSRLVQISVAPPNLPQPENLVATLLSPNVAELNWSVDLSSLYGEFVGGFTIESASASQNGGEWTFLSEITDKDTTSFSVGNLTTDSTYFFRVKSIGARAESAPTGASLNVPGILPEEECQAFFSGRLVGDRDEEEWISEIYVVDAVSEYVGAGVFRLNSLAFPKSVAATFDGIAIDAGTRVVIYSEPELGGDVLYDQVGPAVINNSLFEGVEPYTSYINGLWKEPLQSIFPQNVREWSASNMHPWSNGSLIVDCGYD